MTAVVLGAGGGYFLLNLLASAGLLWLCCRLARPTSDAGGTRGLRFVHALGLTLACTAVTWALLGTTVLLGGSLEELPLGVVLVEAGLLAVVPLLLLRVAWSASWGRRVGVWLAWLVLDGVRLAVAVLVVQALFVEALVFPTGSMAETLLGHHKDIVCPLCALPFTVNATGEAEPFVGATVRIDGCICPSCRHEIALVRPGDPPAPGAALADPGIRGGDRFLSTKGLLTAGWRPERFELVLFRYPGPAETATRSSILYVQRVVGLPGEMLAIHRGKLWTLPAGEVPLVPAPPVTGEARFSPDAEAERLFRAGKFQLIRKPPELTLALRRLVHDADHPVRGPRARGVHGWQPAGGWTSDGAGQFRIDQGDQPLPAVAELVYHHVLPGRAGRELITDFVAHNTGRWGRADGPDRPVELNWVSDLTLECEVEVGQAAGTVTLGLARGPDRFLATFDLAAGTCRLTRRAADDTLEELGQSKAILVPGVPARLRLADVDERLTVWLDDGLLFGDGVPFRPSGPLVPQLGTDLQPALLAATCPRLTVRHVRLHADAYYTAARHGDPSAADAPEFRPDDPATWPLLASAAVSAYRVEAGQYFVLGDNSAACSDSRLWGLLPAQNLVGKPIFRYAPLSRLGALR